MKRVATAAVLIPIVLLLIFRAPDLLFAAVVLAVALLATREYLNLVEAHGVKSFRWSTYVFVAGMVLAFLWKPGGLVLNFTANHNVTSFSWVNVGLTLLVAAPFWLLVLALRREKLAESLPTAAMCLMAVPYIGFGLGSLLRTRAAPWGKFLLLYLMLVIWAGDTFAYYTGRAVGRHKLAPRISPGKTWEGTAASFAGSLAVGGLLFAYSDHVTSFFSSLRLLRPEDAVTSPALLSPGIWAALVLSAFINVAAQLGDLAESAIKRGAGWKDSGTILPGHGGMLDRIDALLFAAPVLCYYALLFV